MKKRVSLGILIVCFLLMYMQCPKKNDDDLSPPQETNPEAIIIDHLCRNFQNIPDQWINQAKSILHIAYQHTSHGSQLVSGLRTLMNGLGGRYVYSSTGWGYEAGVFLNDYGIEGADDLGSPDRSAWADATRELLNNGCDRNVVIWSWCGQVSESSADDIDHYLSLMNQLEIDFPDVKFVYMTGHLDGSGTGGNLHRRNQQIREYCRTYKKILFDFADIESYDPDGNEFLSRDADDGCYYNGGNWAVQWLEGQAGHLYANLAAQCEECAHSENLNCVLKGGAFWWLLARLAGWNGQVN